MTIDKYPGRLEKEPVTKYCIRLIQQYGKATMRFTPKATVLILEGATEEQCPKLSYDQARRIVDAGFIEDLAGEVNDLVTFDGSLIPASFLYKTEVKWMRYAQDRGMSGIGISNELRSWNAVVGRDQIIGCVSNSSVSVLHSDGKHEWYVMLYGNGPSGNITFKKRFAEKDSELAKSWLIEVYGKIMNAVDGDVWYQYRNNIRKFNL